MAAIDLPLRLGQTHHEGSMIGYTLFTGTGETVNALQAQLKLNGSMIPFAETTREFFSPGTRQAVLQFQRINRLLTTGVIDERTTILLASGSLGSSIAGRTGSDLGSSTCSITCLRIVSVDSERCT